MLPCTLFFVPEYVLIELSVVERFGKNCLYISNKKYKKLKRVDIYRQKFSFGEKY